MVVDKQKKVQSSALKTLNMKKSYPTTPKFETGTTSKCCVMEHSKELFNIILRPVNYSICMFCYETLCSYYLHTGPSLQNMVNDFNGWVSLLSPGLNK